MVHLFKYTGICIAVMLLVPIALAAVNTDYFAESPNIKISLTSQEPDPVEPGNQVELRFKIDNKGMIAKNMEAELIPEYPFSLVGKERHFVGIVPTSQKEESKIIIKFRVNVDGKVADGVHEIKLRYRFDGGNWITTDPFGIDIQTSFSILGIKDAITKPEIVGPGGQAELSIKLKNFATTSLKNIRAKLDLGKTSDEETPIVPIGTSNELVVPYLGVGEEKSLIYRLLIAPNAESKYYKIPLELAYWDSYNKNYTTSRIIGFVIGGVPDVSVILDETEIYTDKKSGEIVIKVVNKGSVDVKFVNLKLEETEDYRIISSDQAYVGNIDTDDFETAVFKLYADSEKNKINIPIHIEYEDANNNAYSKNIELKLRLYSASEAKKLGLVKENGFVGILISIAALIIVILIYRKWKKSKK